MAGVAVTDRELREAMLFTPSVITYDPSESWDLVDWEPYQPVDIQRMLDEVKSIDAKIANVFHIFPRQAALYFDSWEPCPTTPDSSQPLND